MQYWFKSNRDFAGGVDFAYWWSCIGKGLRLQPAQQACLYARTKIFILFNNYLSILLDLKMLNVKFLIVEIK